MNEKYEAALDDWREERAKSWDRFADRWLIMSWTFFAGAVALAIFTVRHDGEGVNYLAVGVMFLAGCYFQKMKRDAQRQARTLRNGRRL